MAKTASASKTEQTALASVAPSNDQLAAFNEVFGGMDFEADGLEEKDADDIKTPALVFNLKGEDKNKHSRTLREMMFTDTEEYVTELSFIMVAYAKSHRYTQFNDTENRNETICSSFDRQIGTVRKNHPKLQQVVQGMTRPCATCPDMQWYKNSEGKNKRNCAEISNVIAVQVTGELDEKGFVPPTALGREFMVRFGRTSLPPFEAHLNKHHFKKHPTLRGKDVPLFAYAVTVTMEPQKGGNYAIPVFTKGAMVSGETARQLAEIAKMFRENREERMAAADKQEEKHADAIDTDGESSGGQRSRNEFADDGSE
jgi:hypothetical protein